MLACRGKPAGPSRGRASGLGESSRPARIHLEKQSIEPVLCGFNGKGERRRHAHVGRQVTGEVHVEQPIELALCGVNGKGERRRHAHVDLQGRGLQDTIGGHGRPHAERSPSAGDITKGLAEFGDHESAAKSQCHAAKFLGHENSKTACMNNPDIERGLAEHELVDWRKSASRSRSASRRSAALTACRRAQQFAERSPEDKFSHEVLLTNQSLCGINGKM